MTAERQSSDPIWTHSSVLSFACGEDPFAKMVRTACAVVLRATDAGWSGPPFDPFALAKHLGVAVIPRGDIADARIVPLDSGQLRIEFNPNRPPSRVRYSIAHELAHTLFPDCGQHVRNRLAREEIEGDNWQLEMLCNVGAAELLMPVGSFPQLRDEKLTVDRLLELRQEYGVSSEALFLRAVKLTERPCAMFVASCRESQGAVSPYRIDYSIASDSSELRLPRGLVVAEDSAVTQCTAVGYTSKSDERWAGIGEKVHIECVGIAPYPQCRYPRVLGLLTAKGKGTVGQNRIVYLKGDATSPREQGHRILVHVVNDRTPNWGGGFALVVRRKWPEVQEDFQRGVRDNRRALSLGSVRVADVDGTLSVLSMVSQHGYGPSPSPRIRYAALEACLRQVADVACEKGSTVHMPRIGCGQAGGHWGIVSELIEDLLCRKGIKVTVYDLPGAAAVRQSRQGELFLDRQ